ncbi:hypothetical protein GCM10022197_15220 [Microlunatus spumicola]|uniref:Uncharacterized protein n=1 Tax=Microlunatus spumicola TaxID=81499 RepID=A0ABP6X2Z4_9ACTN
MAPLAGEPGRVVEAQFLDLPNATGSYLPQRGGKARSHRLPRARTLPETAKNIHKVGDIVRPRRFVRLSLLLEASLRCGANTAALSYRGLSLSPWCHPSVSPRRATRENAPPVYAAK